MTRRDTISATYMSGPLDGRTFTWPLPENAGELVIQIGRREGSHILLDYDTQVSRVHARVVYNALTDTLLLEDLGSRNGTFYGQQRVRRARCRCTFAPATCSEWGVPGCASTRSKTPASQPPKKTSRFRRHDARPQSGGS